MRALVFLPRFAPGILARTMRQTLRHKPTRLIAVGELLSLRVWSGVPYQSRQHVILEPVVCTAVLPVRLHLNFDAQQMGVEIDGRVLPDDLVPSFACRGGYADVPEMVADYRDAGIAELDGMLYEWGEFPPGRR